jgi:hypothetical protein
VGEIETPHAERYVPKGFGPLPAQMKPAPGVAAAMSATEMRVFETGATRNTDVAKLDYEGFLSPLVLRKYAEYMHAHRKQADGTLRSADNWQKGIPTDVYVSSMWRHFMDVWMTHRGYEVNSPEDDHVVGMEEALMALLFNVMGYAHEILKEK